MYQIKDNSENNFDLILMCSMALSTGIAIFELTLIKLFKDIENGLIAAKLPEHPAKNIDA